MDYHITVIDRAEREARIQQSVETTTETSNFYDLRGDKTLLKVIRLPINLPIYRMENFRTFSDQAEYVAREHLVADHFRAGQENESTQQVQHELLTKLAAKGKANSVIPIIDVLKREGQREPLLITHRGVVVNGNRRLAAMRELFTHDPGTYHQFSNVNCMVLPADTTSYDILEIEAVLQARPETRLDYDWIGDAQLLSALLKIKNTPEAVAKVLGRKPNEVKNVLQALSEADIYLKDWVMAPSEYNRVAEHGEQLFKDMPSRLEGKPAALQDASRAIAWTLFENGTKLDGRLYSYNIAFGARAADVLDQLADDLGISLETDGVEAGDDYDFDIGEDSANVSYVSLINILKESARKDEAVEILIDICDSVKESERDKKSGSAALKAITIANAKLAEVDLSRAARETYESIESQLTSVIQRAGALQAKIKDIRLQPNQGVSNGGETD